MFVPHCHVQVIVVNHLVDSGLCTAEELATDAAGQFPVSDELGRIQVKQRSG